MLVARWLRLFGSPLSATSTSDTVSLAIFGRFLRELPGGLLGETNTQLLQACAASGDAGARGCEALLESLGPAERATLRWLVHIVDVTQQCESKMPCPHCS